MHDAEIFEFKVTFGFTFWERVRLLFGGKHFVQLKFRMVRSRLENGKTTRALTPVAIHGEVV